MFGKDEFAAAKRRCVPTIHHGKEVGKQSEKGKKNRRKKPKKLRVPEKD